MGWKSLQVAATHPIEEIIGVPGVLGVMRIETQDGKRSARSKGLHGLDDKPARLREVMDGIHAIDQLEAARGKGQAVGRRLDQFQP